MICIEDIDEIQSRSIDRVILNELFIYGYDDKSADGNPIRVSMGPKGFGYSKGPATILNCHLPNGFYNLLNYKGINKYLCYLTFSVEGTNVQRYKIEVNNTVVIDKALNSAGKVTVYWTCPRQMLTSYKVVVYSDDNSATASGKIYGN